MMMMMMSKKRWTSFRTTDLSGLPLLDSEFFHRLDRSIGHGVVLNRWWRTRRRYADDVLKARSIPVDLNLGVVELISKRFNDASVLVLHRSNLFLWMATRRKLNSGRMTEWWFEKRKPDENLDYTEVVYSVLIRFRVKALQARYFL